MRRLSLGRTLLGVLMVVRPPALHAQQSDSILKAQLRNGMFPPNDARGILAVLSEAEARRLPTDGIEVRVRDAVAHNVDGRRTTTTARDYLAALIEARSTIGPAASANEIELGATALALQMPIAAFRRIASARSSVGSPIPLMVAVDVVRHGVPMDSVSLPFVQLVEAHASDTEFIQLLLRVGVARAQGSSVLSAYRSGLDTIRSAHRLPQPRVRVPTGASVG
jgi:hypothetical protein